MEDSAYEAIYTGVFILIFIAALSATLFMFKTVSDIADRAYEYGKVSQTTALLVNVPTDDERYLTKSEVISYIYNYIQRDIYGDKSTNSEYEIQILDKDGNPVTDINEKITADVYKTIVTNLNANKFVLKYKKYDEKALKATITIQAFE